MDRFTILGEDGWWIFIRDNNTGEIFPVSVEKYEKLINDLDESDAE